MKVEFEGRKYEVEWRYDTVIVRSFRGITSTENHRERATCLIRDASTTVPADSGLWPHARPDDSGAHPVIAEGAAVRYYKDPPNRATARKQALAKALDDLYSAPKIRAARREFWKAYEMRGLPAIHEVSGLLTTAHAASQALGDASPEPESKPPSEGLTENERPE